MHRGRGGMWGCRPSYLHGPESSEKQQEIVVLNKGGPAEQPFRFLDLPSKLRDRIYYLALVHDPPIELAGLVPGQRHEDFWEGDDDYEATPIFYGQPFRFTNQAGWITLGHWLDRIGAEKRALLRDITVCHPECSSLLPYVHGSTLPNLLTPFGLNSTPTRYTSSTAPEDVRYGSCVELYMNHHKMLASMSGLRHLRLVLYAAEASECWYKSLADLVKYYAPKIDIRLLHLVSYRPETRYQLHEIAISDVDRPSEAVWRWHPENMECPQPAMRSALELLKRSNITITEQLYDQHSQYPVEPNQPCRDKGMCNYMWQETWVFANRGAPEGPNECPGTSGHREGYTAYV
ncbi:hypothetical protein B0A55_05146 [Friedmanniomyces simplex]|uniref:Uncharacterized protein n=1 Tax=Friedmanniomyces simplex TaxID=329884 RepID=A0A4V5NGA7_9PEZI|nr:hypothetical protein B0A55_05146 [Friedmanniomyces simplex]